MDRIYRITGLTGFSFLGFMNRILLGFLGGLMVGNALVGQEAVTFDRLRFHGAPKGFGEGAVVAE